MELNPRASRCPPRTGGHSFVGLLVFGAAVLYVAVLFGAVPVLAAPPPKPSPGLITLWDDAVRLLLPKAASWPKDVSIIRRKVSGKAGELVDQYGPLVVCKSLGYSFGQGVHLTRSTRSYLDDELSVREILASEDEKEFIAKILERQVTSLRKGSSTDIYAKMRLQQSCQSLLKE